MNQKGHSNKYAGSQRPGQRTLPCHFYFHLEACQNGYNCHYSHNESFRKSFSSQSCHLCKQQPPSRSMGVSSGHQKVEHRAPQPQRKPRTPCHFYHLNIQHDESKCTFSHDGNRQGKCPVPNCPRCRPCHFYHLRIDHDNSSCPFRHEGPPAGRCISQNCPHCKRKPKKAPCHFYHLGQDCPYKNKCTFSHFGNPAGECLVTDCPECEKIKAKEAKEANKAQKKNFEKVSLELPRWAVRKFYGQYKNEISNLFKNAELRTLPNFVVLSYPKDTENILEYWNSITEKFNNSLEKSSWVYPIPGTSLYAVVRNGLEVTDILFPGDYYRIDFTFPLGTTYDVIYQTLGVDEEDIEDIRLSSDKSAVKAMVKFTSKAEALNCFEDFMNAPREEVDCKPVCPTSDQSSFQCSVIVRFSVRKSIGKCAVKYGNEFAAEELCEMLKGKNEIDGYKVTAIQTNNEVTLLNLNPWTNEYTLSRIGYMLGESPKLLLNREEEKEDLDLNFTKGKLPQELNEYAHQIIVNSGSVPKRSKRYPDTYKYEIFFRNKRDALAFAENFEGKSLFGYACCTVSLRFCVNISFMNIIYKMFKGTLDNLPASLNYSDPKLKFDLESIDEESKVGNNRVSFYRKFHLQDHDVTPLDIETEFVQIESVIKDTISKDSVELGKEDKKFAFSPAMQNYYRELAREPVYDKKLYIAFHVINQTLLIFSEDANLRKNASERIRARIARLRELEHAEKFNSNDYRASEIRNYLKRKYPNEQLEWTHFDNVKKELTILTKDAKSRDIVMQTLQHCLKSSKKEDNDEEACEICMANEASYRGIGCTHKFCVTCLEAFYSEAAKGTSIFIRCPTEGCGTKICPYDLAETASPEDLQTLLRRHVSSYLAAHKNHFVYCTNGCPNLIKMPVRGHEPDEITCDACQKSYCGKNMNELHAPHQKGTLCPIDSKLKKELLNDDTKEMECCGDIVEKLEGCNKIKCSCGKYVCWICLKYFEEQDDCYSHLIQAHGGFHEANEIENIMKQNGAKIMSCCGNLIIKDGGCNHIACTFCQKHSCWLCLACYDEAQECYAHMTEAHGGWFS